MSKRIRAAAALAALTCAGLAPAAASAQFYKGKTLTMLVNYGGGGNADTEARVYQRYLPKYIPGKPNVIVQNAPGAGGINAVNMLGLGIGTKADGSMMGYFSVSATDLVVGNPALKVKVSDFIFVTGQRGWNVAYGRKDIPPGLTKPSDIAKATQLFAGGYARASWHDVRLRLSLEIMNLPFTVVTGFPATADVNKAMLQGEVNYSSSSLSGFQSQVIPQIIDPGIGIVLFQFPVVGPDGKPAGNPNLEKAGIKIFDEVYMEAFGKPPSGPKYQALLLTNDIAGKLPRGMMFPNGVPEEAVEALRKAVVQVAADPEFQADFQKVTSERADLVAPQELDALFERVRNLDPAVKQVLQEAMQ